MRFLDTRTGKFVEKDPEKTRYGILSHTWDDKGEQTYGELKMIQQRYVSASQTPQNGQPGPQGGAPSSSEQDKGSPSPTPHSSQITSSSPAGTSGVVAPGQNLAQYDVEAMPCTPDKVHATLTSRPENRSSIPEGGPFSSGQQDTNGPSSTSRDSEQPASNSPSVTTSLLPRSKGCRSCFTRAMARLKTWMKCRSAPQRSHLRSGSPSATKSRLTRLRRRSSRENDRSRPHPVPSPWRLPSDTLLTAEPACLPTAPQVALSLTKLQSDVEALHKCLEAHGLSSPTAASVSIWDDPELSPKIRNACAVARRNGYHYIWIDSCCIDKSSSSELSEAINSMYKWYGRADVYYAYLANVPPREDLQDEDSAFRKSRWFCRGWTLQELIAPFDVEFLSGDWAPIGSKDDLVELVETITNIDYKALLHLEPLDEFGVAQRLSWAAKRNTTREEDQAYSLLGIFDINMPTLYGEGDRAFRRLQEQITQHIPDQSLFAWGDFYVASQVTEVSDTWNALNDIYWPSGDDPRQLFARSPRSFQNCADIRTPQHQYNGTIEYTPTPYGICTQFQMIPVTSDLLGCATRLGKDMKLTFSSTQWYLAILGCEHSQYPGHLLGRVFHIFPSESGVEYVHSGGLHGVTLQQGGREYGPDLFPLSPETIERFRPHTELKTVYIPHPDRTTLSRPYHLRSSPHTTIKLVLLKKDRGALRSQGYSVNLRAPDSTNPTTHSLTLAKDEHTITLELRHTLLNCGNELTIDAEIKMSLGSHAQVDSALGSNQEDCHTVSWWDCTTWEAILRHQLVRLSAAGAGTLTVDLGLDFMGHGYYSLRVDVLSDALPASSAVESAVDLAGEARERTEENSHSGAVDTEDAGREDAGGCKLESMDSGDVAATSGDIECEDSNGASA